MLSHASRKTLVVNESNGEQVGRFSLKDCGGLDTVRLALANTRDRSGPMRVDHVIRYVLAEVVEWCFQRMMWSHNIRTAHCQANGP